MVVYTKTNRILRYNITYVELFKKINSLVFHFLLIPEITMNLVYTW